MRAWVPATGGHQPVRVSAWAGAALPVVLALLVVACGSTPGPSARATDPASPAPTASTGPLASGAAGSAAPRATQWPTPIVETVLALTAADDEIRKATDDLGQAADTQDLAAMRGAADGLVNLLEDISPAVERLAGHPVTAELAEAYGRALPDMIGGASLVRDSLSGGDAAGLADGAAQLARGIDAYQAARGLLGPLAEQALLMKRLLVK